MSNNTHNGIFRVKANGTADEYANNTGGTVDSSLSDSSTNPVENRVITGEIAELNEYTDFIRDSIWSGTLNEGEVLQSPISAGIYTLDMGNTAKSVMCTNLPAGTTIHLNVNCFEIPMGTAIGQTALEAQSATNRLLQIQDQFNTDWETLGSASLKSYSVGDFLTLIDNRTNRKIYVCEVTAPISVGDTIALGTNIAVAPTVYDAIKNIGGSAEDIFNLFYSLKNVRTTFPANGDIVETFYSDYTLTTQVAVATTTFLNDRYISTTIVPVGSDYNYVKSTEFNASGSVTEAFFTLRQPMFSYRSGDTELARNYVHDASNYWRSSLDLAENGNENHAVNHAVYGYDIQNDCFHLSCDLDEMGLTGPKDPIDFSRFGYLHLNFSSSGPVNISIMLTSGQTLRTTGGTTNVCYKRESVSINTAVDSSHVETFDISDVDAVAYFTIFIEATSDTDVYFYNIWFD